MSLISHLERELYGVDCLVVLDCAVVVVYLAAVYTIDGKERARARALDTDVVNCHDYAVKVTLPTSGQGGLTRGELRTRLSEFLMKAVNANKQASVGVIRNWAARILNTPEDARSPRGAQGDSSRQRRRHHSRVRQVLTWAEAPSYVIDVQLGHGNRAGTPFRHSSSIFAVHRFAIADGLANICSIDLLCFCKCSTP